jgi:hypothetical protein
MNSGINISRVATIILMVALTMKVSGQESKTSGYGDTLQLKQRQYFSNLHFGAQLENYKGTKSLIFEFPGKSSNQIYLACLELFRGYTAKIELINNRSIDSYYSKTVDYSVVIGSVAPIAIYSYNYMVTCDEGKLMIENPYISTVYQDINTYTGEVSSDYLSVADFIGLLEELSAKDKAGKSKVKRDELRALLTAGIKTGYQELVVHLNNFTDSLLRRISDGRQLDSLEWLADAKAPVFELSPEGLSSSNNRNYMVIKTPNSNTDDVKKKTQALVNFIHMDEPIEYYRSIIGNRYAFNARRDIPDYVVDSYFDSGIINFSDIYTKYDFGDFQKFVVKKTISATDKAFGVANFEFEITYAPGLVRISTPKISKIEDGLYDWMSKQNAYRSIFSTPDNRVLQPVWKQAVEKYFNELSNFLFRYYSQE